MNLSEKISLLFSDKHHKIGELVVDAFLHESHELRAQATEHPLESGSSFVDHVYNLPVSLSLEGIISNTPLTFMGLTAYRSFDNWQKDVSNNIAEIAFKQLEKIFHDRQPITISTSLKDYKDMILESLSVERSSSSSAALRFSCTAKQIRIVELNRLKLPEPKVERAKPKKNLGKQPARELPKADIAKVEIINKNTSFLSSLFR